MPGQITIVGLGPGAPEQLTQEALTVLNAAPEVYLRTSLHPTVAGLPPQLVLHSFDYLYEEKATLEEVYASIAQAVIELGQRPEGVVYAVPGHSLSGEETVRRILALAKEKVIPVRLVAGVSFLEPVCTALGLDPLAAGLHIVDATALEPPTPFRPLLTINPLVPVLLAQLYSPQVAAMAKLALLELYPDEHPVTIVRAAGVPGQEQVITVPLYQLDRQPWIDHLTCAYLPPLPVEQATRTFAALEHIISRLRNPDGGCPWDREQTHQTLKSSLLEETYEVLAALDDAAPDKLQDELGDLWLQIILHAQIATELDEFTLGEVLHSINSKLLRRHAHVFGDVRLADSAEVLRHWERIKQGEREANGEVGEEQSLLAGLPGQLPALAYAQAVQGRAARLGFDWQELAGVLSVVADELAELRAAANADERRAEFGDVFFALVNAARWLGLDAEEALRLANRRFVRRFQGMEALCRERGLDFERLSFEEQNALWDEVKDKEERQAEGPDLTQDERPKTNDEG